MNKKTDKPTKRIIAAPNGGLVPIVIISVFTLLFGYLSLGSILATGDVELIGLPIGCFALFLICLFVSLRMFFVKIEDKGDRITAKWLFGILTELEKNTLTVSKVRQGGSGRGAYYYILEDAGHTRPEAVSFFRNKKNGYIVFNKRKTAQAFLRGFYDGEPI